MIPGDRRTAFQFRPRNTPIAQKSIRSRAIFPAFRRVLRTDVLFGVRIEQSTVRPLIERWRQLMHDALRRAYKFAVYCTVVLQCINSDVGFRASGPQSIM